MDEADALEALANTLTLLTDNPYDVALHAQHVRLAREIGMEDQLEVALDMVTHYWAAGDYVWLPLLEIKVSSSDLNTAEGITGVLALFERAEGDYLSIPILQKHVELLLERYEYFKEQGTRPDDFEDMFTADWTLNELERVVAKGAAHLEESHKLWDPMRDFMLEYLGEAPADKKPEISARVEAVLLERLKQPHSNNDDTFQAYSSFTTNHKSPDEYESLLVKASKGRSQAIKAYQRREQMERSLNQSGYSLEGYAYYIASERGSKKPDLFVLKTLYERAITEADRRRFSGDTNAESALRTFWLGYVDVLRQHDQDEEAQHAVFMRAMRSIPTCGEIYARCIRFLERTGRGDAIDSVYSNATAINLLASDVDQLVPVVQAKASYERRQAADQEAGVEDGIEAVLATLLEGIGKVRKASKSGDPQLRLEKYFSAVCTDVANMMEHAIVMWEDATKFYKTSYLAWLSHTDVLIKQRLYADARKVFRDVANKNLDWPEAIWDAWIQFEHVHGSVEELEDCLDRVERAREKVAAKRAKEAEKAAYEAMQVTAEQQAATVPVAEAPVPNVSSDSQPAAEVPMDVDAAQQERGSKRKAEDELVPEESKRQHAEASPALLKRDRENCTVFVAELPSETTEEDLRALFKDCGSVREIKITSMPNSLVATVEFMERDSVPAALTKDKKRIHGEEIAVHLAWKSTLYVTNFSESADDKSIRELFGKYGVLFDVRWPSKKFKSTRRFCYVQYTSPNAAEAALELHGRELEPGRTLQVYISNPERRKERTDADANDRELYVAGLAKSVKKDDLEKLFSTYGAIKDIRMGVDDKGHPKGFAFVEFEHEKDALAALAANNHELKKRRIAVTLADPRVKNSKTLAPGKRPSAEVRNRSVRIRGLPSGTQEGLLQQALEKIVKVRRVEVFANKHEAVAECETPAEAGKLLLHPEPIIFDGNTLQLSEESLESISSNRPVGPPATAGSGLFIPRSAISRPRAGLGSKKNAHVTVSAASATTSNASSSATGGTAKPSGTAGKGQDDFRKMLGA